MNEQFREIKHGDGGYVIGSDGDILPLAELSDPDSYVEASDSDENDKFFEMLADEAKQNELELEDLQQTRLEYVNDVYGFYPRSARELSLIMGVDKSRNMDAAKYLSIIMQHQAALPSSQKDPRAASEDVAKSVAAELIALRHDAAATATLLRELLDEVSEAQRSGVDIPSVLSGLGRGEERALAQVVRREMLIDFVDGEITDEKFKFDSNSDFLRKSGDYLDRSSLEELRDITEDTFEEERRRLMFWHEKLRDLKRVTVVSAMARRALGES